MLSTTVAWRSIPGIRLENGVTKVSPMPAARAADQHDLAREQAGAASPSSRSAAETVRKTARPAVVDRRRMLSSVGTRRSSSMMPWPSAAGCRSRSTPRCWRAISSEKEGIVVGPVGDPGRLERAAPFRSSGALTWPRRPRLGRLAGSARAGGRRRRHAGRISAGALHDAKSRRRRCTTAAVGRALVLRGPSAGSNRIGSTTLPASQLPRRERDRRSGRSIRRASSVRSRPDADGRRSLQAPAQALARAAGRRCGSGSASSRSSADRARAGRSSRASQSAMTAAAPGPATDLAEAAHRRSAPARSRRGRLRRPRPEAKVQQLRLELLHGRGSGGRPVARQSAAVARRATRNGDSRVARCQTPDSSLRSGHRGPFDECVAAGVAPDRRRRRRRGGRDRDALARPERHGARHEGSTLRTPTSPSSDTTAVASGWASAIHSVPRTEITAVLVCIWNPDGAATSPTTARTMPNDARTRKFRLSCSGVQRPIQGQTGPFAAGQDRAVT